MSWTFDYLDTERAEMAKTDASYYNDIVHGPGLEYRKDREAWKKMEAKGKELRAAWAATLPPGPDLAQWDAMDMVASPQHRAMLGYCDMYQLVRKERRWRKAANGTLPFTIGPPLRQLPSSPGSPHPHPAIAPTAAASLDDSPIIIAERPASLRSSITHTVPKASPSLTPATEGNSSSSETALKKANVSTKPTLERKIKHSGRGHSNSAGPLPENHTSTTATTTKASPLLSSAESAFTHSQSSMAATIYERKRKGSEEQGEQNEQAEGYNRDKPWGNRKMMIKEMTPTSPRRKRTKSI